MKGIIARVERRSRRPVASRRTRCSTTKPPIRRTSRIRRDPRARLRDGSLKQLAEMSSMPQVLSRQLMFRRLHVRRSGVTRQKRLPARVSPRRKSLVSWPWSGEVIGNHCDVTVLDELAIGQTQAVRGRALPRLRHPRFRRMSPGRRAARPVRSCNRPAAMTRAVFRRPDLANTPADRATLRLVEVVDRDFDFLAPLQIASLLAPLNVITNFSGSLARSSDFVRRMRRPWSFANKA